MRYRTRDRINIGIMRFCSFILFLLFSYTMLIAQSIDSQWYSETDNDGIIIQNSFPKGGPYTGPTSKHHNHSYLVFYTRIYNSRKNTVDFKIDFSADSIAIPDSPDTFVKLFLPQDTMTLDKVPLFSYGITSLESLDHSTRIHRKLEPQEECLFYVVAVFFQTKPGAFNQERGGNRAELILQGGNLYYNMLPQIDLLSCGELTISK